MLPLITTLLATATPMRAAQADVLRSDERLLARVHLHLAGVPISEALRQIGRRSGVSLRAEGEAADVRVVLYTDSRTAADTLTMLAKFFLFAWRREQEAGGYRYVLFEPEGAAEAEKAERLAVFQRAADRIKVQLALVKELSLLTDEQRLERRKAREAALPPLELNRDAEYCILQNWQLSSPVWLAIASAIARVPNDDLAAAMDAKSLELTWPARPPSRPLAEEDARRVIEAVLARVGKPPSPDIPPNPVNAGDRAPQLADATPPAAYNAARIRLLARPQTNPGFQVIATAEAHKDKLEVGRGLGCVLPVETFPPLSMTPAHDEGAKSPALDAPVSFEALPPAEAGIPPPPLAVLMDALEKALPFDLIADAWYSSGVRYSRATRLPLRAVLTTAASASGHEWRVEDGFVVVRSAQFSLDRANDVPPSMVERWEGVDHRRPDLLDRLGEVAALPPGRYETALSVFGAELGEMQRALNIGRNVLAFWQTLTPEQRKQALSTEGLRYTQMNEDVQRKFVMASFEDLVPNWMVHSPNTPWTAEQLAEAVFQVERQSYQMWAYWHELGWVAEKQRAAEEALRQIQRHYPEATLDKLKPVAGEAIIATFGSKKGRNVMRHISMPIEWPVPKP